MSDTKTKVKNIINKLKYCISCHKTKYTLIKDEEYYKAFGIKKKGSKFIVQDTKKVEAAYQKAWENRNYEIDKFWSRALYFWGFIAATFVAYTAVITGNREQIKGITDSNIDICLLALGMVFSTAWIISIKGSKRWQENWEKHIDYLENFVSGSIHKTIFYRGKRYYSVSKMSEYVAWFVFGVWFILLLQTLNKRFTIGFDNIEIIATTIIILMVAMILFMWICGESKRYFTEKGTKKRIKKTSFYIRKRKEDLPDTEVEEEIKVELEEKNNA